MKLAFLLALAAAGASRWSPPAVLNSCPAVAAPRVVFPSDSPSHATGAGAVIWSASRRCPGGEGARVAPLAAGDVPGDSIIPRSAAGRALALRGALLASGAPHGQIALAGTTASAPAQGLLIQGAAGGPFSRLAPPAGSSAPTALASAYLGDLGFAAPPTGNAGADELRVRVERFYAHSFGHSASIRTAGRGPVQALTLALDYRSEALVVWVQGGAIYACVVPSDGVPHAVQRIAPVAEQPHIAALLSDDNRAIIAWSDTRGDETRVHVDRSAVGERFGAAQLLERFDDPDGLPAPAASPSLARLSSESVVLAWAGAAAGHWVVRTAPIDLNGVGAVSTIAAPLQDALLADLTAGPADDALLLWTEPLPDVAGDPQTQPQALFAARSSAGVAFGEAEQIAPAGTVNGVQAAFDPDSDRAIAAWQGAAGAIEYSISTSSAAPLAGARSSSTRRARRAHAPL